MTPEHAGHLPLTQAIVGLAMSASTDDRKTNTDAVAKCKTGVTVNRYGVGKPTTFGDNSGINAMAHLAHSMGVTTTALEKSVNDSSRGISKSATNQCFEIARGIVFAADIMYVTEDAEGKKHTRVRGRDLAEAAAPLTDHWHAMCLSWAVEDHSVTITSDDAPSFEDADDDGPTFESIATGSEEATVTTTTDSKAVTVFTSLDQFKAFCKTDTAAVVEKARAMLATKTENGTFARVHHSKSRSTFVEPEDRAAVIARFSSEEAFYDTIVEAIGWDALRLKPFIRNNAQRKAAMGRGNDCPAHQLLTAKGATVSGVKSLVRILGAACLVNGGRSFYTNRAAANVPESFADAFLGAFGMDPSVAPVGAKNDRTWRWAYDPTGWDRTAGTNTPSVSDLADMFL